MNRPRFFIAGNSKSGTTALYAFLQQHPHLFLCDPKEPDYFCHDFNDDPRPGHHFHQQSEAEYLALFEDAAPDQLCGEASACYLYSEAAAEALHAFDPEARLIFMLREPVDFLHSYHLQLLKNPVSEGEVEKRFEQALALEPRRRAGEAVPEGCYVPEMLYYRERIRYVDQLQRYLDRFDREQVLILIYDDFKRDNAAVVRKVYRFLGVDPDFTPAFATHNKGAALRSKRMQRLMRAVTFGEGWAAPVKRVLKAAVPTSLRRRAVEGIYQNVVFKPKTTVDPELARRLRAEFRPEVERLGELLGRDMVAEWGYARETDEVVR